MTRNWYKKAMPTVRQVKPFIADLAKTVKSIKGVNRVFLWGALIKNINNPKFALKNVDIIAETDFFSEDLLSIDKNPNSPFNLKKKDLLEEGFDPLAVSFTKKYTQLKKYNINHWTISNDKKLLHWGAMTENKEDYEDMSTEAEKYASFLTGKERKILFKENQQIKDRWSTLYEYYINKKLSGMPVGWYLLNYNIKDIISETLQIA